MAKRRIEDARSSKMTVMIFQLEGDDATLQEGFKTISAAMSRVLPATPPMLTVATHPIGLPAPHIDSDDNEDVLEAPESPVSRSRSNTKRSVTSPQILDLDLAKGDLPLADFLAKHPTEETTKRYLLIAYWLKNQRNLVEVSMDHIHTCFRHMGWQTPKRAAQPLRDMKSRLGWFHKGDEKGHYKINHVGENEVLKIIEGKS